MRLHTTRPTQGSSRGAPVSRWPAHQLIVALSLFGACKSASEGDGASTSAITETTASDPTGANESTASGQSGTSPAETGSGGSDTVSGESTAVGDSAGIDSTGATAETSPLRVVQLAVNTGPVDVLLDGMPLVEDLEFHMASPPIPVPIEAALDVVPADGDPMSSLLVVDRATLAGVSTTIVLAGDAEQQGGSPPLTAFELVDIGSEIAQEDLHVQLLHVARDLAEIHFSTNDLPATQELAWGNASTLVVAAGEASLRFDTDGDLELDAIATFTRPGGTGLNAYLTSDALGLILILHDSDGTLESIYL